MHKLSANYIIQRFQALPENLGAYLTFRHLDQARLPTTERWGKYDAACRPFGTIQVSGYLGPCSYPETGQPLFQPQVHNSASSSRTSLRVTPAICSDHCGDVFKELQWSEEMAGVALERV